MKQKNSINYGILSSHRSGSSLLCNLLTQTKVAGTPNEFFSDWEGALVRQYNMPDYEAYLNRIISESITDNGVFGVKIMGGDLIHFFRHLEASSKYSSYTNAEKIQLLFPNMKFIYLTRRNKVEQSISWWKTVQNQHYHTTDDDKIPDTPLKYKFDAISHLIKELVAEECAHQEILRLLDIVPLTLVYEDYIQDMAGTVQKIIDYLEIEDDYTFHEPELYKMADSVTKEWAERYRQELQDGWTNIRW